MTRSEFEKLFYNIVRVGEKTMLESRFSASKVLKRPLKPKEQVHHHYNKDFSATLVICQDQQYHMLLERRELAKRHTGDPNSRNCAYCKKWDDPFNMTVLKNRYAYHKSCKALDSKKHRRRVLLTV